MNSAQIFALTFILSLPGCAATENERTTYPANEQMSDAWLKTKIVTTYTLNEHLNPFRIDVDVTNGVATLSGSVENDIQRDLAEEIAKGVDGVRTVNNRLTVNSRTERDTAGGKFMRYVDDANITSQVKSKLLMNPNTKGMKISVSTHNGVVVLDGTVASEEEAALARQLALNTEGVADVHSNLIVSSK